MFSVIEAYTGVEAKALGRLFSKAVTSTPKRGPAFDPGGVLTGLPNSNKKKRAATSKGRSVNVSVCRLKHFSSFIPKGRVRNLLKQQGRIMTVQLTRLMSPSAVKTYISRAFRDIKKEWQYLEAGQENRLSVISNQSLDGDQVCSRRGCLYIVDKDVRL